MPVFQWRKSGAINNRTLINRRCTFLNLSLTYVKRKKKEKKILVSTRTNIKRFFILCAEL